MLAVSKATGRRVTGRITQDQDKRHERRKGSPIAALALAFGDTRHH